MTKLTRFQDCPWWIRLWRRRHYWRVPIVLWRLRRARWGMDDPDDPEQPITWQEAWAIAIGEAQVRMEWWYTWREVRDYLNARGRDGR